MYGAVGSWRRWYYSVLGLTTMFASVFVAKAAEDVHVIFLVIQRLWQDCDYSKRTSSHELQLQSNVLMGIGYDPSLLIDPRLS